MGILYLQQKEKVPLSNKTDDIPIWKEHLPVLMLVKQ